MLSTYGILVNPQMVATVENLERPQNVTEIQNFLGLAGYYWRFVKDFSIIALPSQSWPRKESNSNGTMNVSRFFSS